MMPNFLEKRKSDRANMAHAHERIHKYFHEGSEEFVQHQNMVPVCIFTYKTIEDAKAMYAKYNGKPVPDGKGGIFVVLFFNEITKIKK